MKILKIYTDGGLSSSVGASAFLILDKKNNVIVESVTTYDVELDNNKFELVAIINALNWLRSNGFSPKKYRIYVYTDHQPTQLGLCEYLSLWKRESWIQEIKFKSLWQYIDLIVDTEFSSIYFQWLPKSTNNLWHQRVDELCTIAMKDFKSSNIELCLTEKIQQKEKMRSKKKQSHCYTGTVKSCCLGLQDVERH